MSEKLQKYLARLGVDSRRAIERMIESGRITVNGVVAHLGERIEGNEAIHIDGKPMAMAPAQEETAVLVYHKPVGEVCTRHDESQRPTVFEHLPPPPSGRWVMVGRLDLNTAGLLLFTNDGELANQLMHPKHEVIREYACRVLGHIDDAILQRLVDGVILEDGESAFKHITHHASEGANQWYYVTLCSGKNREVRRLWESQGLQVSRLIRIRYGTVILPESLNPGESLTLSSHEVSRLKKLF
jgi:23S rRNA pseudouridine2605 synthase